MDNASIYNALRMPWSIVFCVTETNYNCKYATSNYADFMQEFVIGMVIESLSGKFTVKFAAIFLLLFAIVVSFFSFEAAIALIAALFILGIAKKVSMVHYTRTYTGEE